MDEFFSLDLQKIVETATVIHYSGQKTKVNGLGNANKFFLIIQ